MEAALQYRVGLSETIPGCIRIEPTAPEVLKGIFAQVPIFSDDILVDIGCGDGDVIDHWLSMGLKNQIIGMEWHGDTFESTRDKFKGNVQVEIIHGNAAHNPPAGTIYYLFNPFRGEQMVAFEKAVPKTARIIYYNPTEKEVFSNWNSKEIWSTHPKAILLSGDSPSMKPNM